MKLRKVIVEDPAPQHLAWLANRIIEMQPTANTGVYFFFELRLPDQGIMLEFTPPVRVEIISADHLNEHTLRLLYSLCCASPYSHRSHFETELIYTLDLNHHETHYIYLLDRIMLRDRAKIQLENKEPIKEDDLFRHELISHRVIGQGHYSKAVSSITLEPDHALRQMKISPKLRIAHCEITPQRKLNSSHTTVLSRLEAIGILNHLHGKNPVTRILPDGSKETVTIMRKLGDMSLMQLIEKHRNCEIRLPIADIIKIVENCWRALIEQIHDKPGALVHGDIKPDNMTISLQDANKYQVFIVDPNSVARSGQKGSQIPFTRRYSAPERYDENYVTNQTFDVYCMGISLLELFGMDYSNSDTQIYDVLLDYALPELIRIKIKAYFDIVLEWNHTARLSSVAALTHWQSISNDYHVLQPLNAAVVNEYLEQMKCYLDYLACLPLTAHMDSPHNLKTYTNLFIDAFSLAENSSLSLTLLDIEQKINIKLMERGDYRNYLPRLIANVSNAIDFILDFERIRTIIAVLSTVTYPAIVDGIKSKFQALEPGIIELRNELAARKLNINDLTTFEVYWNKQHRLCAYINLLKVLTLMMTEAGKQHSIKSRLYHYINLILSAQTIVESDLVILTLAKDVLIDENLKDHVLNSMRYDLEILADAVVNDFDEELGIDVDVEETRLLLQKTCDEPFHGDLDYSKVFESIYANVTSPRSSPKP